MSRSLVELSAKGNFGQFLGILYRILSRTSPLLETVLIREQQALLMTQPSSQPGLLIKMLNVTRCLFPGFKFAFVHSLGSQLFVLPNASGSFFHFPKQGWLSQFKLYWVNDLIPFNVFEEAAWEILRAVDFVLNRIMLFSPRNF